MLTGGQSAHTHMHGGQLEKLSGNAKISVQLNCSKKMSAHFIFRCRNQHPETMQTDARIAFKELRKYQFDSI